MFENQAGLEIRPVHPDDADALYEIVRQPAVARNLMQIPSMEISETRKWVQQAQTGRHRLVAVYKKRIVGSIGLSQYSNPRLSHGGRMGMYVDPEFWGQGIGKALMAALLDLSDNWLNLKRVELEVYTHNTAAIHLYEKFGFAREGTRRQFVFGDGGWFDIFVMARLRDLEIVAERAEPPATRPGDEKEAEKLPVQVRPVHPDDAAALYDIWRNPAVARSTFQLPSQEWSQTAECMEKPPPGAHRLVATHGSEVLGMITLMQEQNPRRAHAGTLGMMVHPNYWGRGVGSSLLAGALDLADNWLNLRRVELDVFVDNQVGIRLYDRHGFVVEGTRRRHAFGDGRWADSHFMARMHTKD